MTAMNDPAPYQPNGRHVISALQEELKAAQENRLYLIAMIKQMQEEFAEQKALWEIEKASLIAAKEE